MRKYLAEFSGTFALVFCGTGAIVMNQHTQGAVGDAGIAIAFGLIVAVMIYSLGGISGAHLNPAVTIAFWAARLFPAKEIVPYIISQCAGAFLASFALAFLFPYNKLLGTTLPSGSEGQSFVLEFILSLILMFVILQVAQGAKERGLFAGISIGSVVFLEAFFAGPVSGASMNPARSLAPAIVSGHTEHVWIYLAAPASGMLFSVLLYGMVKAYRPGRN